jgi:hypothetical protein
MPGIEFTRVELNWENPIIKPAKSDLEGWLALLDKKKIVEWKDRPPTSQENEYLLDLGIWWEFKGETLPVSVTDGISLQSLSLNPKALAKLRLDHGLCILKMHPLDRTILEIGIAAEADLPLGIVCHLLPVHGKVEDPYWVAATMSHYVTQVFVQEEEADPLPTEDNSEPFSKDDLSMWSQIWDMLADHPENRSQFIERCVGEGPASVLKDIIIGQSTGQLVLSAPASPRSKSGVNTDIDTDDGEESPFEDVWDELGV